MHLLMQGSPGAGKGTHGRRLAKDLGIPHIATGELLRAQVASGTPLGREARAFMDRGDYVPDDVMVEMIRSRLSEADASNGFILDGFPRTQGQANALDKLLADLGQQIDAVVVLEVPFEEMVRRLSGRRTCPTCHRSYHMDDDPPRSDEVCDDDGTPLERRTDDEPETVRHRLKVYADRTAGVIEHYDVDSIVRRVDGQASIDEVSKRIDAALGIRP
ncbi:MAG TPA: adenylate kinase [Actinomycetota bacterium]|jgi:adenylate kinase|nr:adenylate kinase [Actinomycetota bacterium]